MNRTGMKIRSVGFFCQKNYPYKNSNPIFLYGIACSQLRNKILLRKEGDLSCERSCFILF